MPASAPPTPIRTPVVPVLNFFPATFTSTSVSVWVGRWRDTEQVQQLRKDIPGLVTWRDPTDASRLYVWHPTTELADDPPNFQPVTVTVDEIPQLFQRLITDAVSARFRALGFVQRDRAFVNYARGSIVASVPALVDTASEPIGIYPKIISDVFFTKDASGRVTVGLLVDVLYTTRLDVSAAEWIAAGLAQHITGSYLCLLPDTSDAAKYPELVGRVLGRVHSIRAQENRAILTDVRKDAPTDVALTSVAPEPTRGNLEAYLVARHEAAFRTGQPQLAAKLQALVQPHKRHELIHAVVHKRLQPGRVMVGAQETPTQTPSDTVGLWVLPGVKVSFGEMAEVHPETFPLRRLNAPSYSFDGAGRKYKERIDSGLKLYGPYDQHVMSSSSYRFLVVAPKQNKGEVQAAVGKLLNGIKSQQNVFGGLCSMYRLAQIQIVYAFADVNPQAPTAGYVEAIRQAKLEHSGVSFDLVLAVIHEAHRNLPDSENPYYQAKSFVLSIEGVPTQMLTIEKLRKRDYDLQYILNTVALTCYAKLGGTSHVLRLPGGETSAATELVFGVGRTVTRRNGNRFGEAEETIGFTTVFRANGEYLYNDCTPYCGSQEYERELETTIRRTVEEVVRFEQLPDGAPLRLIFHVPRRPGSREVQPILNAVGKLPRYKIEFALVHINEDHSFQIFDRTRANAPDAPFLPPRGFAVTIGPRERLVTFVGPAQYRGRGCPTPLRLTLHPRSTFTDLEHLTQQLYLLSFMSARSLSPGVKPVTLAYAERLAHLTGHLRGVTDWAVQMITTKLGRKLWYI